MDNSFRRWLLVSVSVSSAIVLAATPARAQDTAQSSQDWGFYVNAIGGLSFLSNRTYDYDPVSGLPAEGNANIGSGYLFGGAVGFEPIENVRIEAEYIYRSNSLNSLGFAPFEDATGDDLASVTIFGNAYYDLVEFDTDWASFKPYVGAGLGLAQEIDTDIVTPDINAQFSGDGFTWQLMTGVNWYYDSGLFAGLGARYTNAGTLSLTGDNGTIRTKYDPFAVTLNVGYRF